MKRRRDDSVKPGCGIDGNNGANFSRQYARNPWDSNPEGDYMSPQGAGAYEDENADFLRNVEDYQFRAKTRNIADQVEQQSNLESDSGARRIREVE
jgi:hypothetical protein